MGVPWLLWWEGLGLGLVAFLTVYSYSPVFSAGFVWDDRAAILSNRDVIGTSTWWEMLSHDFWGQDIHHSSSHKSFRPVTTASLRLEHWLAGGSDEVWAHGMHATNVGLHVAATWALHWMCRAVGASRAGALAAALLFGVHAVHIDAVASIVGRAEILAGAFFAVAVAVYAGAVPARGSEGTTRQGLARVGGAILAVAAAGLSKEVGITAIAVFMALEACPPDSEVVRADSRRGPSGEGGVLAEHASWTLSGLVRRHAWIRLVPVLALSAAALGWRVAIQSGGTVYRWRPLENRLAHLPRGKSLVLSTAWTHARALGLVLWPDALAFDHGLGCSSLVHDVTDPRTAVAAAAYGLLLLVLLAAVALRRRPAVIGMAVFVATYAPAANVLVFVGLEVAERVMYLPSAGLILAAVDLAPAVAAWCERGGPEAALRWAVGVHGSAADRIGLEAAEPEAEEPRAEEPRAARQPVAVRPAGDTGPAPTAAPATGPAGGSRWGSGMLLAMLLAAAGALCARTLAYAPAWRDELSLFRAGVAVCPHNAKASNNLAYLLTIGEGVAGSRDEAEALLRGAVAQWPHHASAYLNLALLWSKVGVPNASTAAFCGPPAVDELAERARRLGATTGNDAAFAPLWAGAVALHETPHQILLWLARQMLVAASGGDPQLPAVTPVTVAEARRRGLPPGDVALPWGMGWAVPNRSLTPQQLRLGGGAMTMWVQRFVKNGQSLAGSKLVEEGTPLDHGIAPPGQFKWLSRHKQPYPPRYSDADAATVSSIPQFMVGLRLLEEATASGARGSQAEELYRWRAIAASMGGSPAGTVGEAQACLEVGAKPSQARILQMGAIGAAAGASKDARNACQLLLAGALIQLGRGSEAATVALVDAATAGMDIGSLAAAATEVTMFGQQELAVELVRRAMLLPGADRNGALLNNYGWALDLAGRTGSAIGVYQRVLDGGASGRIDVPPQVESIVKVNRDVAVRRLREARSMTQQQWQSQAVRADGSAVPMPPVS